MRRPNRRPNYSETEDITNWEETADYIIYKDGDVTIAVNGNTGKEDSRNTDAQTVIQYAIDALTSGGLIFIKQGSYDIADNISLDDYITLSGEGYSTILNMTAAKGVKAVSKTEVIVENLRIDGNRAIVGGGAINLQGIGCTKCVFRNVFSHDAGADGIGFWQASTYCIVTECYTWDNGTNGLFIEGTGAGDSLKCGVVNCVSIDDGQTAGDGIRITESDDCLAEGNTLVGSSRSGIILNNTNKTIVTGNYIYNPTQGGIALGNSISSVCNGNIVDTCGAGYDAISVSGDGNVISNNNVLNSSGSGILTDSNSLCQIIGNRITGSGTNGIYVRIATDIIVEGNTVYENEQKGINIYRSQHCTISNNIVKNNSNAGAGGHDGIYVWDNTGAACTDNVIAGNVCHDDQGTKTQGYGIRSTESSDYNLITGNNCRDNLTGNIAIVGANTILRANIGHRTENEGVTAAIADGATIAHGLVTTPTGAIAVGTVAGEIIQVTALGAANITVAIKTNAGAAGTNQVIYWRAWV